MFKQIHPSYRIFIEKLNLLNLIQMKLGSTKTVVFFQFVENVKNEKDL